MWIFCERYFLIQPNTYAIDDRPLNDSDYDDANLSSSPKTSTPSSDDHDAPKSEIDAFSTMNVIWIAISYDSTSCCSCSIFCVSSYVSSPFQNSKLSSLTIDFVASISSSHRRDSRRQQQQCELHWEERAMDRVAVELHYTCRHVSAEVSSTVRWDR